MNYSIPGQKSVFCPLMKMANILQLLLYTVPSSKVLERQGQFLCFRYSHEDILGLYSKDEYKTRISAFISWHLHFIYNKTSKFEPCHKTFISFIL